MNFRKVSQGWSAHGSLLKRGPSKSTRLVAEALDLEASEFMMLVRSGHITSLCESGVGADEGHFRLTFFFRGKRLRLIVDRCGHQTRMTMIDFGDRPLPSK